ncbi:hypothetical protein [Bowmanella dokdonensis]|uniref:Uncharacterized protein n=1 Tax=Bowmanella dokdonensis TaxID=751969 RepID=A0A939DPU5_9ALTE|nr:hypothetical protein [Bowmanella dokdonensis]MBN7825731.1 hypothetical protein [Bowmanella dokdonensis]
MRMIKNKSGLAILALISGWGLMFWIQWSSNLPEGINLIGIPALMILLGLLAGLAMEGEDN